MKTKLIQIQMKNFADPFSDEWRLRPFCSSDLWTSTLLFPSNSLNWIAKDNYVFCENNLCEPRRGKSIKVEKLPGSQAAVASCCLLGLRQLAQLEVDELKLSRCLPAWPQHVKNLHWTHIYVTRHLPTLEQDRAWMTVDWNTIDGWNHHMIDTYICKIANIFLVTAQWSIETPTANAFPNSSFVTFYNNQDMVVSGDWKETGHLGVLSTEN